MGDPGVGKSALAAHLTHFGRDKIIAAQFVEWDKADHRGARRVIRSLAFQMACRLSDYRKLLLTPPEIADLDRKDASELFDYLLANPLRTAIGGGRERHIIVIDALDEAGESGRNPLVEMLARHAERLPDWFGLVVTSRPESAVQAPLQGLNPFVLDTRTEANRADLRDFLQNTLAPQLRDRPNADRLLNQILEKSEGVFLYVERFCNDVRQNHVSLDHPDQFPQGLGGIFAQWFQRQFPDVERFRRNVRPALRAILAAREPLPVEILQRLFDWQDEELRDFTRTLGSLFPVTKDAYGETIKPYHKSLADWLVNEAKAGEFFVSENEGHRLLAEAGWCEYQCSVENLDHYWFMTLPKHLAYMKRSADLGEILASAHFLGKFLSSMLEPQNNSTLYGNDVADFCLVYHSKSEENATLAELRLQHFLGLTTSIAEAAHFRSSGSIDMKAKCTKCGRVGILHGVKDLGGWTEFNFHYFSFCPTCYWAWHTSDYFSVGDERTREFDYDDNCYW